MSCYINFKLCNKRNPLELCGNKYFFIFVFVTRKHYAINKLINKS